MHVQIRGNIRVDLPQKGEKLLVPMIRPAMGQHLSIRYVQGSEQGRCPVTHVIVGDPLNVAQPQGQHRLRTLQGLALTLLVHTQNQGVFRGIEVQPDHIP